MNPITHLIVGFVTALVTLTQLVAKPNVLLILTDNQAYHELGCHGHETLQTPHIDQLASESVDFTNFHAPNYCSPSRGVLMSGKYALRSGIHNTIGGVSLLHMSDTTLADHLKEAGYRTAIFGKWHLGMSYPHQPQERGFEHSFIHGGGGIGQLEDYFGNSHMNATYWQNKVPYKSTGFSTDVLFSKAQDFIAEESQRPFFCFISTPATHKPWEPHPQVAERIKKRLGKTKDLSLLSMIENIDDNVGAILEQLDQQQILDETLVIFLTDQGIHNRGAPKNDPNNPPSHLADMGHHVFCMMRYPKVISRPHRNNALTGMIDIVPTVLDLCGITPPPMMDGRSLKPLLGGLSTWSDDRELIIQCPRKRERIKWDNSTVKTQRWRLVNGEKLYDVTTNSKECSQYFPEVLQQLRSSYEAFWNSLPPTEDVLSRHLIGSNPTELCAMDWYQGASPWRWPKKVTKPVQAQGTWAVEVTEAGTYMFELRAFPREAEKTFQATSATLNIGDLQVTKALDGTIQHTILQMDLTPGKYDLSSSFQNGKKQFGAMFVYINKIPR